MLRLFRKQLASEVLVKDPVKSAFNPAEHAGKYASFHWEYAVMSCVAYENSRSSASTNHRKSVGSIPHRTEILPAWSRWEGFPSEALREKLTLCGLNVEVWEREKHPKAIAVVFEGTNFCSLPDWRANLRWILRFLPNFEDQYIVAADDVARALYERLVTDSKRYKIEVGNAQLLSANNDPIKVVAAGHSLGGGLAQHFAYAFQQPFISGGPKVSEVFAFNASPVTGWTVVPRGIRSWNARNLRINRVYEHGEILVFLRFLTNLTASYTEHPSIWEYRYNFDPSWNLIGNHAIGRLADGLKRAAGVIEN